MLIGMSARDAFERFEAGFAEAYESRLARETFGFAEVCVAGIQSRLAAGLENIRATRLINMVDGLALRPGSFHGPDENSPWGRIDVDRGATLVEVHVSEPLDEDVVTLYSMKLVWSGSRDALTLTSEYLYGYREIRERQGAFRTAFSVGPDGIEGSRGMLGDFVKAAKIAKRLSK